MNAIEFAATARQIEILAEKMRGFKSEPVPDYAPDSYERVLGKYEAMSKLADVERLAEALANAFIVR